MCFNCCLGTNKVWSRMQNELRKELLKQRRAPGSPSIHRREDRSTVACCKTRLSLLCVYPRCVQRTRVLDIKCSPLPPNSTVPLCVRRRQSKSVTWIHPVYRNKYALPQAVLSAQINTCVRVSRCSVLRQTLVNVKGVISFFLFFFFPPPFNIR